MHDADQKGRNDKGGSAFIDYMQMGSLLVFGTIAGKTFCGPAISPSKLNFDMYKLTIVEINITTSIPKIS